MTTTNPTPPTATTGTRQEPTAGPATQTVTDRVLRTPDGRVSLRFPVRVAAASTAIALVAFAVAVVGISTGEFPIPIPDVLRTLAGQGDDATNFVIGTLRLPRVLTGLLVGAALGAAGAVFQSLTRNPLGSPDIIGFTTGAATGAIVAILMLDLGALGVSSAAVTSGLATALAVYLLAYRNGVQGYRLVLVGIGVNAMLMSANSYLLTRSEVYDAQSAAVWITGSLNGRGWEHAVPVGLALAVLLPFAIGLSRRMRMLEMGDDSAAALGVPTERSRLALLVAAVGMAAVATAAAGPIAFVALAAPQLARRLTKQPGVGIVSSALMGALVLSAADLGAQRLFGETQLPVGVMTGAVGGGYLVWLLAREWRAGH